MTSNHPSISTMAGSRQAALRVGYGTTALLAPRAAARRAARLFCLLPDGAGRRKDFRPGPGELIEIEGPGSRRLIAEQWGTGPLVYLLHGWGGWRGQMGAFVAPLQAAGYRVVAVDALSHGDSDPGRWGPKHSTGAEMTASYEAAFDRLGPAAGMVAHSLGCAATSLAVREGRHTDRLALVAPSQDLDPQARLLARHLGLGRRAADQVVADLAEMAGRPVEDFDPARMGADGSMPPTLVVHDLRDKEVPHAAGRAVAEAWPTARLVTTDGLGHQRILADAGVVSTVVQHLTRVDEPVG